MEGPEVAKAMAKAGLEVAMAVATQAGSATTASVEKEATAVRKQKVLPRPPARMPGVPTGSSGECEHAALEQQPDAGGTPLPAPCAVGELPTASPGPLARGLPRL